MKELAVQVYPIHGVWAAVCNQGDLYEEYPDVSKACQALDHHVITVHSAIVRSTAERWFHDNPQ